MRTNFLVSVYIPTKSRPNLAHRAVCSVINQDYTNIEIIVVDDGSSLNDFQELSALLVKYKNVVLLKNQGKPGASGARNTAIHASTGYYLTGLDDDDVFTLSRISELVACYEKVSLPVCTNYLEFYEDIGRYRQLELAKEGRFSFKELAEKNLVGNQIFARRDDYIAVDGFDEKQACWEDYDLWMRMVEHAGGAWKINSKTYIMNIGFRRARISTDISRAEGIIMFVEKYRHCMTNKEIFKHTLEYNEKTGRRLANLGNVLCAIRYGYVLLLAKKIFKRAIFNRLL